MDCSFKTHSHVLLNFLITSVSVVQIQFAEPLQIEAIITQGDPSDDKNFVPTYTVKYTQDNVTWLDVVDTNQDVVVSTLF